MRTLRAWLCRVFGIGPSAQSDEEFASELQNHLQMHVEDGMRAGLTEREARRRALVAIGGVAQMEEQLRDQRGVPLAAQFIQDVRHAIRLLRVHLGFSAAAIIVLALGIGANTAVFGMIDGLLLRALPVERPDELVRVTSREDPILDFTRFDRLRRDARSFSAVFAVYQAAGRTPVETDIGIERLFVQAVSENYFSALGVPPHVGRAFDSQTTNWASDSVALVSDGYARRRHDDPASILGSQVTYFTRTFTVVGVMPPGFFGVEHPAPDVWVPLSQIYPPDDQIWVRARFLKVMARLAPGTGIEEAQAEARVIAGENARLALEPGANGFSSLRERFAEPMLLLQGLVALVLLVACANLANLLLARGASRQREIAVRLAVGASRGRLVRQFATESLVLGAAGGVGALMVAVLLSNAVLSLMSPAMLDAAAPLALRLDGRLLLFAAAMALCTSVLFGIVPALRTTAARSRHDVRSRLLTGRGRGTTSRGLVVSAVALSCALVVVSGLFVRTLQNLRTGDTGFAPKNLVVAQVQMPPVPLPRPTLAQYEDLLTRIRALPATQAAGFSRIGQLTGGFIVFPIALPGESLSPEVLAERPDAAEQRVSPGFLEAMGTTIIHGRDVRDDDTATAPAVALVNEAFVRTYFNGAPPIGLRFLALEQELQIVGVVKDTRWVDLRESDRPMFYRPARQATPTGATFAVRSSTSLAVVADHLARVATDVGVRFEEVVPFTDMVNRTLVTERLLAYVSAGVGVLALVIVGVGLYAFLAYTVAQRTSEIGIRRALGATGPQVQWIVLRDCLLLVSVGLTLGLGVVVVAAPALRAMLFELAPTDATTFAIAAGALIAITVVAASLPARRAATVDPAIALRGDGS